MDTSFIHLLTSVSGKYVNVYIHRSIVHDLRVGVALV